MSKNSLFANIADPIRLGYSYQLLPTPEQESLLSQWVGSNRKVWNLLVAEFRQYIKENTKTIVENGVEKKQYPKINWGELRYDKKITKWKAEADKEYLKKVESRVFALTYQNLQKAHNSFHAKLKRGDIFREKAEYINRKKLGKGKRN